jgi:hypothetical protein
MSVNIVVENSQIHKHLVDTKTRIKKNDNNSNEHSYKHHETLPFRLLEIRLSPLLHRRIIFSLRRDKL